MDKKEVFKKVIIESQAERFDVVKRDLILPTDVRKVITLYGPRRCGKTYLFHQTIQGLLANKVLPQQIIYVNFEDERIMPFLKEDWELLLDAYLELYPENLDKEIYIFLDEVQEAPLWEKFVRRVSEKRNFRVFLTGSSSKLFAQEISTTLRGRTLGFFLLPCSFPEFLRFKNFKMGHQLEYSPLRHKAKQLFREYLEFGGFPEIFDKETTIKNQILQGYFDLIFYKDIVERYKLRNFNLMKDLMRYLTSNFSSLFSVTNYYNYLKSQGQKIGKDTLFEYISCLEEVNFVKFMPIFDYSFKKQTVNPKKAYCIDTGLVSAVSFQFSENKGRYLENVAFLELLRKGKQAFYFKNYKQAEVDFLVLEKNKPRQLFQVTSSIEEPAIRKREVAALVTAADKFNIDECIILTNDQKTELKEGNRVIKVIPLWQWLIGRK